METMKILATLRFVIENYEDEDVCTVDIFDNTREKQNEYIVDVDVSYYKSIVGFLPFKPSDYDLVYNVEENTLTFEYSVKKDYVNHLEFSEFNLIKTYDNKNVGFTYLYNGLFYNVVFDYPIEMMIINKENSPTRRIVRLELSEYSEFSVTVKECELLRKRFNSDFEVLNGTPEYLPDNVRTYNLSILKFWGYRNV